MKKILILSALLIVCAMLSASVYSLTWTKSIEAFDGRNWIVYTATQPDTIAVEATAISTAKLTHVLPFDRKSYLWVNPEAATLDSAATKIDMYGGFSTDFALSVSNQTVTVTDGCILNDGTAIETDVQSSCAVIEFDPDKTIADTANISYKLPKVPYVAFTVIPTTQFEAVSGDVIIFKLMIPPD